MKFSEFSNVRKGIEARKIECQKIQDEEKCINEELDNLIIEQREKQKKQRELHEYKELEPIFLKKIENEKYSRSPYCLNSTHGNFRSIIFTFKKYNRIKRKDLVTQSNCSEGSVKKTIALLKKFDLIENVGIGYCKKIKFNRFLRIFLKKYPGFI